MKPSTPDPSHDQPPREWDAGSYHRVSEPHVRWGLKVLESVELDGGEVALDVGCGTGRLTEKLLERLPRGHVYANDQSTQMLDAARAYLAPRFGGRVTFLPGDATALTVERPCDLVFSTATFHWIADHDRLFSTLFAVLRRGGRLVAQCGGAGNLAEARSAARALMADERYCRFFVRWANPWNYATAEDAAARLAAAGFTDIHTSLEPSPMQLPGEAAFREFVATVVLRAQLAALPDEETQRGFLDEVTAHAASTAVPFTLDYVRLNLRAVKPR